MDAKAQDQPHTHSQGWSLLSQGAEARVYKITFLSRPTIVKERFIKKYRHPTLDAKINNARVVSESRTLQRARAFGIDAPALYHVDTTNLRIFMEYIDGKSIKQIIFDQPNCAGPEMEQMARQVGTCIAKLHSSDLIHGDLTTSNMMVRSDTSSVAIIDFGLSFSSTLVEDKAVDLYVLERAFVSTHPSSDSFFNSILASYFKAVKDSRQISARLEKVRMRGRKRTAFG